MSRSGLGRPMSNWKLCFKDVFEHVIVDSLNATQCIVGCLSHIALLRLKDFDSSSRMQMVLNDDARSPFPPDGFAYACPYLFLKGTIAFGSGAAIVNLKTMP